VSRLSLKFPPVASLATVSLGLVIVGGILLASYAPRRPPLTVPVILLCLSAVILASSVFLLVRLQDFAWKTFGTVFKWSLLAYGISAAMIAFAFIKDHVRGAPLVVVLLMLVIFAVSVPICIAFTVGRFMDPATESS
jgi:hypothetical protein